jgi:hypothetical protein
MPVDQLRRMVLLVVGGCLVILAAVLAVRSPADPLDNPAYTALSRAHTRKLASQAAALDSARTALVQHTAQTGRTLVRYSTIRDSVFVPVSHTDTVEVLAKLPRFLTASDSLHDACTSLVESCAVFRVRADSSISGLMLDRDLWKGIAESRKPSRWDVVREWGIRAGVFYLGVKTGQAAR